MTRKDFLISFLLFSTGFIYCLVFLLKSPSPAGSDAYVYLVQARSLAETGSLHYPDLSIVHPLMALFYLAAKGSATAYALCCAFLLGTASAVMYMVTLPVSKNRITAGACALLCTAGPFYVFFASQFPKQFLGMILFVLFVHLARSRRIPAAVFVFILLFFSHRLAAALAVVYLLIQMLAMRLTFRTFLYITGGMLLVAIVVMFAGGAFHPSDAARFRGAFSARPVFAPLAFMDMFGRRLTSPSLAAEALLLYLLLPLGFFSLFLSGRGRESWRISLMIVLFILLFPFFTMNGGSPGYRFFLAALFAAPLVIPLERIKRRFVIATGIVVICAGGYSLALDTPSRYGPPYELYARIVNAAEKTLRGKDVELVVAHRPVAEMIDYMLRTDALAWRPEKRFDRTRTWRLARDVEPWEITSLAGIMKDVPGPVRISPRYVMVREDVWDRFTERIGDEDRDLKGRVMSDCNPSRVRPDFITRGRN